MKKILFLMIVIIMSSFVNADSSVRGGFDFSCSGTDADYLVCDDFNDASINTGVWNTNCGASEANNVLSTTGTCRGAIWGGGGTYMPFNNSVDFCIEAKAEASNRWIASLEPDTNHNDADQAACLGMSLSAGTGDVDMSVRNNFQCSGGGTHAITVAVNTNHTYLWCYNSSSTNWTYRQYDTGGSQVDFVEQTSNSDLSANVGFGFFSDVGGAITKLDYALGWLGDRNEAPYLLAPENNTIVVDLSSPMDGEVNNTNLIDFVYNVTSFGITLSSCSLYTNMSGTWQINQTDNSPINNSPNNFTGINFSTDGDYKWNVACVNQSFFANSNFTFTIDTVNPILDSAVFTNLSVTITKNITGEFSFSDNNLIHSVNITVDGTTSLFLNESINLQTLAVNISKDVSGLSKGQHELIVRFADGHTSKKLKSPKSYNPKNGIFNDYMEYNFEAPYEVGSIRITQKGSSIFDSWGTSEKNDRYQFSFRPNSKKSSYTFEIESDSKIHIVEAENSNYDFPWLIYEEHWLDFAPYNDVVFNRITDTKVEVTINGVDPNADEIIFNSIGDLNVVIVSYNFTIANVSETFASTILQTVQPTTTLSLDVIKTTGLLDPSYVLLNWNNTFKFAERTVSNSSLSRYSVTLNDYNNMTQFNLNSTVFQINVSHNWSIQFQENIVLSSNVNFPGAIEKGFNFSDGSTSSDELDLQLLKSVGPGGKFHILKDKGAADGWGSAPDYQCYNISYSKDRLNLSAGDNVCVNLTTSKGIGSFGIIEVIDAENIQYNLLNDNVSGYDTPIYQNQSVQIAAADNCSVFGIRAINFSTKTDNNDSLMRSNTNAYVELHTINTGAITMSNLTWTNQNEFGLCISQANVTYNIFAQLEYQDTPRELKEATYYLTNATVSNDTQLIDLFLTPGASLVTFTVLDQNDDAVNNVFINILRYDFGTNTHKTNQIIKTDSQGKAIGNIVLNTDWYKFFLFRNGVSLFESEPVKLTSIARTFRVDLTKNKFKLISGLNDVITGITYTNSTRNFAYTWTNPTGGSITGCMKVVQKDITGDSLINKTCLTSSSGTILINVGNQTQIEGNRYIAMGSIQVNPIAWKEMLEVNFDEDFAKWGKDGIFMVFMLKMAMALIGIWSPVIAILMMAVVDVFLISTGLLTLSWSFLITYFILGGIIIWRISSK